MSWGRGRVANQLALLNISLAASTVRNIFNRPKPRTGPKPAPKPKKEEDKIRSIPAWYPNHVWSIDTTMVYCWGLWPIHVFVAIDHFSRKVMAVVPLALPKRVREWSLRTLRVKLIKIGAKVVKHARHVVFQMAEVLVSKALFQEIFEHIHRLKPVPNGYG